MADNLSPLKQYAKQHGTSLKAIAESLGIRQNYLSELDGGKKKSSCVVARDLYVLTGGHLSPFYLLERFEASNGAQSSFDHRTINSAPDQTEQLSETTQ